MITSLIYNFVFSFTFFTKINTYFFDYFLCTFSKENLSIIFISLKSHWLFTVFTFWIFRVYGHLGYKMGHINYDSCEYNKKNQIQKINPIANIKFIKNIHDKVLFCCGLGLCVVSATYGLLFIFMSYLNNLIILYRIEIFAQDLANV